MDKEKAVFYGKISADRFSYDRKLREEALSKVEVLGKVKELFTIPELDLMPIPLIAEYFGVTGNSVRRYLKDYEDEFKEDGMRHIDAAGIAKMLGDSAKSELVRRGVVRFTLSDGRVFDYPTVGTLVLPRRAVLRMGMLMRRSDVAREIRTQLLNTFEVSEPESHTRLLEEESGLLSDLVKAFADGTPDQVLVAAQSVYKYQRRHIDALEAKLAQVSQDNELLACKIMTWQRPAKLNKAVRVIAGKGQVPTGFIWKAFYDELLYKHGICLAHRGEKPYTQHIKDEEWPIVQQTLSAISESHGVSPSYVFKRAKLIEA